MLLLNYSHPITDAQLAQLRELLGETLEIRSIAVQIDQSTALAPQIAGLVDAAGLSPEEWQSTPFLINPAGFAAATAALLAEIHGRSGQFPAMVRIRPVVDSTPTRYEIAEIINLQQLREQSRRRR